MSERHRLNLTLQPALYDELLELAGGVRTDLPSLVVRLVERALKIEREPELGLRRPQQVAIDPGPLLEPMRELDARLREVHRVVEQFNAYLMIKAPVDKHQAALYEARDQAARAVAAFERRQTNGGGA